jgi:DnaK suppressor protein
VTPAELAAFRARLLKHRDELLAAGDVKVEALRDDAVSKIDDDAAPLSEMNQVIASRRNAERVASLARIRDALQRIANEPEEFGICESCDEPIPHARLLLLPHVRLCAACQEEEESDVTRGGRRHLTDYV